MTDKTENYLKRREIAQRKYGMIAPVITGTLGDENPTSYFKRIEDLGIEYPDGSIRKFKAKTYVYWVYLYRHGGFEALMPKERLDNGQSRKLSNDAKERIKELIKEFPKITGTFIWSKLKDEGYFDKTEASVDSVQRYIKNNDLRNSLEPAKKERRAWEYAHSLDGWEADTAHTLYVRNSDGEYSKTYLIAIIDDHSRLIVGARFFFNDNAINFQKVWKSAVMRYGKSKVLILDNGSPYKNNSTKLIASKLGTHLIYCHPYSPQEKSKVERLFLNIRNSWLNADKGSNYHGIDELNEQLDRWVAEYNRKEHSALRDDEADNHTPMQRFMYDMKDIEPHMTCNKSAVEFQDWLDECFLHEEIRKVNNDSTVKILQTSFDVPSQFIGMKVILRYDPATLEKVYLHDPANKKRYELKRTDRVENSKTRRTEIMY